MWSLYIKGFSENFRFLESLGFSFEKSGERKNTGVKGSVYAITLTFSHFL
jgi:hypothetical protein